MEILLTLHSTLRWIVVIAAVVALVVMAATWLRNEQHSRADRTVMTAFTGLLDLQALLGIILLVWMSSIGGGAFPRYRLEHAFTMIVAVILAHLSARWKNSPAAVRARNNLIIVVIALLLIWVGVRQLPKGWTW